MDQPTLEEAIDRVVAGPARKNHVITAEERWVVSIHESAHAVVTRSIGQQVSAQKLSIVARGRQLGTAAHMLTDRDAVMHSQTDLERQLVAVLSGTAAEWTEFGEGSTGSSDDLHAATKLARRMVTSYGMSPVLGSITIGEAGGEVFLGAALQDLGSVGPNTLDTIDEETERIIEEAKARATHVLRANWEPVQETARALLEHETLSGMALEALLSAVTEFEMSEIPLPAAQEELRESP
jgi:cell division protease FtsH